MKKERSDEIKGNRHLFYQAILTNEEVLKFCADFYILESARMTEVKIEPDERNKAFYVYLTPKGVGIELLQASFKEGCLCKWHEKFEKTLDT